MKRFFIPAFFILSIIFSNLSEVAALGPGGAVRPGMGGAQQQPQPAAGYQEQVVPNLAASSLLANDLVPTPKLNSGVIAPVSPLSNLVPAVNTNIVNDVAPINNFSSGLGAVVVGGGQVELDFDIAGPIQNYPVANPQIGEPYVCSGPLCNSPVVDEPCNNEAREPGEKWCRTKNQESKGNGSWSCKLWSMRYPVYRVCPGKPDQFIGYRLITPGESEALFCSGAMTDCVRSADQPDSGDEPSAPAGESPSGDDGGSAEPSSPSDSGDGAGGSAPSSPSVPVGPSGQPSKPTSGPVPTDGGSGSTPLAPVAPTAPVKPPTPPVVTPPAPVASNPVVPAANPVKPPCKKVPKVITKLIWVKEKDYWCQSCNDWIYKWVQRQVTETIYVCEDEVGGPSSPSAPGASGGNGGGGNSAPVGGSPSGKSGGGIPVPSIPKVPSLPVPTLPNIPAVPKVKVPSTPPVSLPPFVNPIPPKVKDLLPNIPGLNLQVISALEVEVPFKRMIENECPVVLFYLRTPEGRALFKEVKETTEVGKMLTELGCTKAISAKQERILAGITQALLNGPVTDFNFAVLIDPKGVKALARDIGLLKILENLDLEQ